MDDATIAKDKLASLHGGEYIDDLRTNAGTIERVKVRKLPLRHQLRLMELRIDGDSQGIVELCLDLPPNGADKYPPEEQLRLYEKAKELNFQIAEQLVLMMNQDSQKLAPLYQRTARRMMEQLGPLLTKLGEAQTESTVARLQPLLTSLTRAPTSPSHSDSPASSSSTKTPTGSA